AALALVAITTTLVAVALVAIEFLAAIAVAALAVEALAGRTALTRVLTRFLPCFRRCAFSGHGGSRRIRWRTLARFAEIIAAATAMTLLARRALAAFASGCRRRAFGRTAVMTLAIAVVMRTAFVGTATGTPDLDQNRLGRRVGFCLSGGRFNGRRFCARYFGSSGFGWRGLAGSRLCRSFRRACRLSLCHSLFNRRNFSGRLRCSFDRRRLRHSGGRFADRRDAGQQRDRRRGIARDREIGRDFCSRCLYFRRCLRRGLGARLDRRRFSGNGLDNNFRRRLRRQRRTLVHAIAERAQHRGEILARRSGE